VPRRHRTVEPGKALLQGVACWGWLPCGARGRSGGSRVPDLTPCPDGYAADGGQGGWRVPPRSVQTWTLWTSTPRANTPGGPTKGRKHAFNRLGSPSSRPTKTLARMSLIGLLPKSHCCVTMHYGRFPRIEPGWGVLMHTVRLDSFLLAPAGYRSDCWMYGIWHRLSILASHREDSETHTGSPSFLTSDKGGTR